MLTQDIFLMDQTTSWYEEDKMHPGYIVKVTA